MKRLCKVLINRGKTSKVSCTEIAVIISTVEFRKLWTGEGVPVSTRRDLRMEKKNPIKVEPIRNEVVLGLYTHSASSEEVCNIFFCDEI